MSATKQLILFSFLHFNIIETAHNNTLRNSVHFVCLEDQQTWPEKLIFTQTHKYSHDRYVQAVTDKKKIKFRDTFRHFTGSTWS
jgi:hypothetical protein